MLKRTTKSRPRKSTDATPLDSKSVSDLTTSALQDQRNKTFTILRKSDTETKTSRDTKTKFRTEQEELFSRFIEKVNEDQTIKRKSGIVPSTSDKVNLIFTDESEMVPFTLDLEEQEIDVNVLQLVLEQVDLH